MAASAVPASAGIPSLESAEPSGRLGLDQPAGWWPAVPRLKAYEAAGFRQLQVRIGSRELLADGDLVLEQACALRDAVGLTGLRLIAHAPDDLMAGTPEHDHQLAGALRYSALAGADMLVYHGLNVPVGHPQALSRLIAEEESLRSLVPLAVNLGVRIAIENLAPVYPGREHISHCPAAVAKLVRRLDSPQVGICLDIGHAQIAADHAGCGLVQMIAPVLDRVILFELHDNFGARPRAPRAGGIEPVRLDLHLAPGAGIVPWSALASTLSGHPAPLVLEIHPFKRPPAATLAVVMREVLGLGPPVGAV